VTDGSPAQPISK